MAKKFSVNVHYDMVISIDNIIAESEAEALQIAENMAQDMDIAKDGECYDVNSCVTDEEPV